MLCDAIGISFFFFKQKTAYEMRISDWSSDVCSSDLDGETAFDLAEDHAFDALVGVEALLQLLPGFLAAGLVTADDGFALGILDAVEEHLDHVTHLDLGGETRAGEVLHRHAAFALQPDTAQRERTEERSVGEEWGSTGRIWGAEDY